MNLYKNYDKALQISEQQKISLWEALCTEIQLPALLRTYASLSGRQCAILLPPTGDYSSPTLLASSSATPPEPGSTPIPIMAGEIHIGNWVDTGKTETNSPNPEAATALQRHLLTLIGDLARKEVYIRHNQTRCDELLARHQCIEERYRMMLDNISEGVLIYDANQTIIAANEKAYQIYHIPKGKLIGIIPQDYNQQIVDENMQPLSADQFPTRHIFKTGESIKDRVLGYLIAGNSDIIWVRLNGAAISHTDGCVSEVLITVEDISLQKQKMDAIAQTMKDMEKNLQMVQLGTYSSSIREQKWVSSFMHQHILGIEHCRVNTHTNWLTVLHPEWKNKVEQAFNDIRERRDDNYNFIYKIVKPNTGAERWIRDVGRILYDEQGQPDMAIGTIQDITDLKQAEEQARNNEEKYRSIFENVQDVYYKIASDYRILEVSPSLRFMTELEAAELIGTDATELLTDRSKLTLMNQIIQDEGGLKDFHLLLTDRRGHTLPVSMSARVVRNPEGQILSYEGFVRDISYRKKIESLLKQSESKLRSYIEFAPTLIAITDQERRIIETNPACSKLTGYSLQDISQLHFEDLFAPESMDLLEPHLQQMLTHGSSSNEFALQCKNGEIRYLQIDSTVLPDGKIISFGIDISYRKKLAQSLLQNKEILEEAQQLAKVGNAIIDFETGTWQSSENFDKLIGLTPGFQKINTSWKQIIHPDDIGPIRDYFHNTLKPEHQDFMRELRIVRLNDHKTIWIKAIGQAFFNSAATLKSIRFSMQDISEQKLRLELLNSRETLYRTTLNASPDVIVVVDRNNCIKIVSNAALKLFRYDTLYELLGRNILSFVTPDDRPRARKDLAHAYQFSIGTRELKIMKSNGEIFIGEVTGDIIRDDQHQPTGLVLIIRDISERKRVQQQLIESEKQLKSIGLRLQRVREEEKTALAREIHDDLGQIMVAMKIDLGLLKNKVLKNQTSPNPPTIAAQIEAILQLNNKTIEAARRIMDELRTDELLTNGFVPTATKMIEQFETRNCIQTEFFCPATNLDLDKNRSITLYRILQEALSNITKYARATEVNIHLITGPGYLEMTIKDDGCGFDINQHPRSNAYGLRGIRERILLLEGEADIQSQPGNGTCIRIKIPYSTPLKNNSDYM